MNHLMMIYTIEKVVAENSDKININTSVSFNLI
jgi:hypothetical protein